jgi:hypothetical protein
MQTVRPFTVWQLAAPGPTQLTLPSIDRQRSGSARTGPQRAAAVRAAAGRRRSIFGIDDLLAMKKS